MSERPSRSQAFHNLAPSAVVLLVLVGGALVDRYAQYVLSLTVTAMVIGVALTMLVGYARCITLGTGAMMAIGAYTSSVAVLELGMTYLVSVVAGGVAGAIGGYLLAVPGVRFRSHNLAMVTLVFQAVVIILLREWRSVTGGAEGLNVEPPTVFGWTLTGDYGVLVLIAAVCALTVLPVAILINGAYGKNLRALASNEVGARAFGINIEHHLIAAFTVSSAAIAIAGALSAPRYRIIDPDSYGILTSIFTLAYPIVGGMQSIWGGLIGGGALRILPELLRPVADFIELFFCILVIGTVMFFPGGLLELLGRARDALRRRPAAAHAARATAVETHGAMPAHISAGRGGPETSAGPKNGFALVAERVSKHYGALRAVDEVSIAVGAGSLHGLMGPNGAGKTTLFNTISGFVKADSGRIDCLGASLTEVPVDARIALGVSRTFQQVAIFPRLSCMDNVRIGLGRNGIWTTFARSFDEAAGGRRTREERELARWALDAVGLGGLQDTPAGALSLGNQRRLEIARAIVSRPRLLLLDEPVSGVGHSEARQLSDLLRRINAELGVTMLVVEHNIGFLVELCDRLSVMSSGRIVADGKPEEVVSRGDVREVYFGEAKAAS